MYDYLYSVSCEESLRSCNYCILTKRLVNLSLFKKRAIELGFAKSRILGLRACQRIGSTDSKTSFQKQEGSCLGHTKETGISFS